MMRYQILMVLTFTLFLSACGNQIGDDASYLQLADSLPKKWSLTSLPVTLKVSDTFDNDSFLVIQNMGQEWNAANANSQDFFSITQTTSEKNYDHSDKYLDGEMGIYNLTTWPTPLPQEALAVTQTFSHIKDSNGVKYTEIFHVDILVNNEYHVISNVKSFGSYFLQTILIHELGHAIGLRHYTGNFDFSVMTSSISTLNSFNELYSYDITAINELYYPTAGSGVARASLTADTHIHSESELIPGTNIIRTIHELRKDGCTHHP